MTKVVYIVGHGYSGSTLLTLLLGTHPRVATIGELRIAPRVMRRVASLDLRILHLMGDGRAVSWSTMRNAGLRPAAAARSWDDDKLAAERTRRYFPPDCWMTVRYEDLCADGTLSAIHRFAGLPAVDGFRAFHKSDHHIIGNRTRLAATSEIRHDNSWKQALQTDQMAAIERRVDDLNRRYGYGAL